jgi:hypothetical protein
MEPNTNAADFKDEEVDLILKQELQNVYLKMKNSKATWTDGINVELCKYKEECLMERMLNCLNKCWRKCKLWKNGKMQKLCHYFKKDKGIVVIIIEALDS